MSDRSSMGSFPWASAAVLVAFVASTQLVPHAFEALRPAEKARAQAPLDPDLELNARLWEDPFSALRRYETERAERCERFRKQTAASVDVDCREGVVEARRPASLLPKLDRDHDKRLDDTLLLIGLLPGADFVGAEEARRRIRYAALAGLQAQDYVPDNAERLSLLEFETLQPSPPAAAGKASGAATAASAKGNFVVPYELLSARRGPRDRAEAAASPDKARRYAQIALLWVDENSLPNRKLDSLARLVQQVMGQTVRASVGLEKGDPPPRLAVIGPSSTDALRTALVDLRCAAERSSTPSPSVAARCAATGPSGALQSGKLEDDTLEGYRLLSTAEFYNSASTAPNSMLDELRDQKLESFVTDQFNRITSDPAPQPVKMLRTIGTDNELIKRLVGELNLRLPHAAKRRIVIVAERDSLYAQSLVSELKYRLKDEERLRYEVIYFFRGIDGVTTRESADRAGAPPPKAAGATLEWPESRDQLDYLRRLAQSLKASESNPALAPIGAIGIFANDVHDKLLILQALHEDFSDKMFFTTDMDARYLHPRTQAFTRNLVVASSLPLAFYSAPDPRPPGVVDLQAGTPPLRDIYQTSTYAAARRAGCRSEPCKAAEREALELALSNPSVYEVGRGGSVPLSGYALEARPPQSGAGRAFVALAMVVLVGGALLVWPSTPAIRQARAVFLREPTLNNQPQMDMTAIVLVALHAGLLAYVLASLIEFVLPNQLNFVHSLLLASLAAFGALLAVLPALLAARRDQPTPADEPAGVDRLHLSAVLIVAVAWLWLAWPAGGWSQGLAGRERVCDVCEPVAWLEGVSAWPSHLLHLIALVTILWTFDWAWSDTLRLLRQDAQWLHLPMPEPLAPTRTSWRGLMARWFDHFSVLFWRSGVGRSCDFEQLWLEYGERGESRPRAARTLIWFVITAVLMSLLFVSLSEGQIPAVPVRGLEHRQMVSATLYAIVLLLPLLIVAVADATVLCVRFVRHLNAGRSFYPHATVEMFAKALGDEHAALWSARMLAEPEERNQTGAGYAVHTLLDDWIDVQVVARRTAPIARLVIGPFIVLALLVVARSRLFDNWSLTMAIAVGVSFYVACLIGLTVLLKQAAETTRRKALESMQADLRWIAGSGKPLSDLVEPFKRLIAAVEGNSAGAFASFFDQPLLKALLVPLGGAGGTQLFDYLLLGR